MHNPFAEVINDAEKRGVKVACINSSGKPVFLTPWKAVDSAVKRDVRDRGYCELTYGPPTFFNMYYNDYMESWLAFPWWEMLVAETISNPEVNCYLIEVV